MSGKRKGIRASEYVAHLSSHKGFEAKMSILTDKYASLGSRLVSINGGAKWMWNWVDAEYPEATQILDYYHAKEHLGAFAGFCFRQSDERGGWVERLGELLKKQGLKMVVEVIGKLGRKTQTISEY